MTTIQDEPIVMPEDCVLAVGKFESLHAGHRVLIETVKRYATEYTLPSAVVTFDPHPRKALSDQSYKPLFTRAERRVMLEELGVDYLVEYTFDRNFAQTPPEIFGERLFTALRARLVVVGEGCRFGRDRAGSADLLTRLAQAHNSRVVVIGNRNTADNEKISSTDIRRLIDEAAITEASQRLGFPFFIMGTVLPGKQIGRTLGFPTVNIEPSPDKFLLPDGVYVTQTLYAGKRYNGVTNIGRKPTVAGSDEARTVETFLMNFHKDIYGAEIRVEILTHIRAERKFDSIEALREQIRRDRETAECFFKRF